MSNYLEEQKKIYKQLKPCFCPALQEVVHFNSTGLNHLLYNRRRPRSIKEKYYRASTIEHLTEVIAHATQVVKTVKSDNPTVITWSLTHRCRDRNRVMQTIKVILIKKGVGRIYFLSAMKKKRFNSN